MGSQRNMRIGGKSSGVLPGPIGGKRSGRPPMALGDKNNC